MTRDEARKIAHDKLQAHGVTVNHWAWVMPCNGGAYVECWVWVSDEDRQPERKPGTDSTTEALGCRCRGNDSITR